MLLTTNYTTYKQRRRRNKKKIVDGSTIQLVSYKILDVKQDLISQSVATSSIPETLDVPVVKPIEPSPVVIQEVSYEKAEVELNAIVSEKINVGYGVSTSKLKSLKENTRNKLEQLKEVEAIVMNDDNLLQAWKTISETLTAKKMLYRNAVANSKLTFTNDDVTINSTIVAIEYLRTERLQLLNFFKLFYKNENINVLFEVIPEEIDPNAPEIRGTKEIYESMIAKNPLLKKLRDGLGMDLEY